MANVQRIPRMFPYYARSGALRNFHDYICPIIKYQLHTSEAVNALDYKPSPVQTKAKAKPFHGSEGPCFAKERGEHALVGAGVSEEGAAVREPTKYCLSRNLSVLLSLTERSIGQRGAWRSERKYCANVQLGVFRSEFSLSAGRGTVIEGSYEASLSVATAFGRPPQTSIGLKYADKL